MSTHFIEVEGLRKSFHGKTVLNGINLTVDSNQLMVLIGPSGCGKSTLLRCLNGLEIIDQGRISINGMTLRRNADGAAADKEYSRIAHQLRAAMGMVFQSFNLFPHMTALENVVRPQVVVRKTPISQAKESGIQLLEKVGLKDKLHRYPHEMSGGEQQRAAIARALAMKPKVMLYDEPTSALDPGLVDEVLEVMRELNREGITQIVVTHEMHFARNAAKKIVFMSEGNIVEEGNPVQMFSEPVDLRTRQFLKRYL
jgi:ABC-type polar amino acid transport system ATPase subunit